MTPRLLPPLALAALACAFFAPLLAHPRGSFHNDRSDFLAEYVPVKRFLVGETQRSGELPLWCPYTLGGLPLVHDIQACAFYPPHWPLYFLPEEQMGCALSWLIVFHVAVAGVSMYAYARAEGLDRAGAFVAGLSFMFAGKWLTHLLAAGHSNFTPVAWLPLVLLLLDGAMRARERTVAASFQLAVSPASWKLAATVWAVAAGAVFALVVLGSHPQLTFYAGLFVAGWSLRSAFADGGRRLPALGRWIGFGALMAGVAVALSAVQLLPTLEAARETSRGNASIHISDLVFTIQTALFVVGPPPPPGAFGWEYRCVLGVVGMTAAVLGWQRGGRRERFWAAVALVPFVFMFGGWALAEKLPGFGLFRIPARALFVGALPVALLIGSATQSLFTTPAPTRLPRRLVVGLLLSGAVLLGVQFALDRTRTLQLAHGVALVAIPLTLGMLVRYRGSPTFLWKATWMVLLLAEAWSLTFPLVRVVDENALLEPTTSIRYLAERRDQHGRTLDRDAPGHVNEAVSPVGVTLPVVHGVELVRGYNPIDLYRYKEYLKFLEGQAGPVPPTNVVGNIDVKHRSLLDLLGVRYLVQAQSEKPPGEGWEKVADDESPSAFCFLAGGVIAMPPYAIYENRQALPRAFVVPSAEPMPAGSPLPALVRTDFRRTVLLSGAAKATTHLGAFRPAEVVDYRPNRVVLTTEGETPGFLVLTDPWYPGWVCRIDGEPVPLYRANHVFRAVEVPSGRHEVVFAFEPSSLARGKTVSLVALAAVVFVLAVGGGRRMPGNKDRQRAEIPVRDPLGP